MQSNVQIASTAEAQPKHYRMLARTDVAAKVRKSVPWLYVAIKDPALNFPAPVKLGKSSRWIEAEIDAWLEARAAARSVRASAA